MTGKDWHLPFETLIGTSMHREESEMNRYFQSGRKLDVAFAIGSMRLRSNILA